MSTQAIESISFSDSTDFLYSLEKFGIKMDLDNISALLETAGRPQDKLKVVHVAGTNGKGSTCAMIASMLTEAGFKTGLYTSPHIERFNERIKIDGVEIDSTVVDELTEFFRPEVVRLRATFFETTTAMMFKYFFDQDVDYAVVETGLGGRLDATNVVVPMISVITGIALDHTEILGDTLEKIAFEKAGIIKHRRPVVVNVKSESVKEVFLKIAAERDAPISFVADECAASDINEEIDSVSFRAEISGTDYGRVTVGSGGKYQVQNALTALSAVRVMRSIGLDVKEEAEKAGLIDLKRNTGHRGRLEIIGREPLVIMDVAHNPDGVRALFDSLSPLRGRKGVLLFGAMKDKDARAMLNILRNRFDVIILTQLQSGRSLNGVELNKLSADVKLGAQVYGNSNEALGAALSQINDDKFLLIAGSHYLAGEVAPVLRKKI